MRLDARYGGATWEHWAVIGLFLGLVVVAGGCLLMTPVMSLQRLRLNPDTLAWIGPLANRRIAVPRSRLARAVHCWIDFDETGTARGTKQPLVFLLDADGRCVLQLSLRIW